MKNYLNLRLLAGLALTINSLCLTLFSAPVSAATNLIINGDFANPYEGLSNVISDYNVIGWTNFSNSDGMEIGNTGVYGLSPYVDALGHIATQTAELNGNTFDSMSQNITGLTIGSSYTLSWGYGDRPGSGYQRTDISIGGLLLATDTDNGTTDTGWHTNTVKFVATAQNEELTFASENTSALGGLASYGNEITGVTLVQNVPEPSSLLLLATGFLGYGIRRTKIRLAQLNDC